MTLGQLALDLGDTQDKRKDDHPRIAWRGYMGAKASPGKVRELFYQRYGRLPAKVLRSGCIMLAGPIGGARCE
jgi:hypothetical protein